MSSTATRHHDPFVATRWSLIIAAKGEPDSGARAAFEELAESYWPPIYAYIRRQGNSQSDAADLTQEFFAQVIEKQFLASAEAGKGRFRAFLLSCVNHFLSNQRDKSRAVRRGGNKKIISLESAEFKYAQEPADSLSPERLFERRWALTVLDRVLARLEADYRLHGQHALFAALKGTLTDGAAPDHAVRARTLGMTPAAVKVAAHRLRRRYRDILKQEIAQTVATPGEISDEITYLLNCL